MNNYVLVVDDNPSDQKLAKLLIESEGFISVLASDALGALDKLEEYEFKLFVVDIQMPQISGLELLKRLKRIEKVKEIPVLIMSGRNTVNDVKKAISLGACDYVIKPIDPAIFSAKLALILRNKKTEWAEYTIDEERKISFLQEYCEILTINEIGITLKYKHSVGLDENRSIGGILFDEIGIGVCLARCCECNEVENGFYIVKMSFIGLRDEDRRKLRLYCRQLPTRWQDKKDNSTPKITGSK